MQRGLLRRNTARALVGLIVLAISACTNRSGPSTKTDQGAKTGPTTTNAPAITDAGNDLPVELHDVTLAGLKEAINAKKGKVVVLDFWGTGCPPCMREFHNLVEIHRKYGKDTVCMSVSLDTAKQKAAALGFLKKQNASLANYFLMDGFATAGKEWGFAGIPVVVVYDTAGARARIFKNTDPEAIPFDYKADVIPLIEKLLKK